MMEQSGEVEGVGASSRKKGTKIEFANYVLFAHHPAACLAWPGSELFPQM